MIGMSAATGKALGDLSYLRQSIRDILTTPKGSRVMRRGYGSDLFELIDAPMNRDMSCCRFGGHEDKIVTHEPERKYGETKVWS
jgi:phage baseplate assembly protein W